MELGIWNSNIEVNEFKIQYSSRSWNRHYRHHHHHQKLPSRVNLYLSLIITEELPTVQSQKRVCQVYQHKDRNGCDATTNPHFSNPRLHQLPYSQFLQNETTSNALLFLAHISIPALPPPHRIFLSIQFHAQLLLTSRSSYRSIYFSFR